MPRPLMLALAVLAALTAGPAVAQTMPLNDFIATADRIPRNPTALLRADFRRLRREFEGGLGAVARAQGEAREAGRTPVTCIPSEIKLDPEALLTRLKAIPEPRRRTMTITDGIREIMRRQYPCPAA
ncbi:hypothetical protein [Brevundimonas sp.]|uniref:hypothetical protein n=1 Tax=Brevundimonas sp. TaxID=1871086 RepID=UPI0035B3175B